MACLVPCRVHHLVIPAQAGIEGNERYVLCEINVSSVAPFPPSAIAPLAAAVKRRPQRA